MGLDSTGKYYRDQVVRDLNKAIAKMNEALYMLKNQKGIGAEFAAKRIEQQIKACKTAIGMVDDL